MSEVKIMLGTSFTELENGQTYYARVYTVNPEGYMQSEIGTQVGSAIPMEGLDLAALPEGSIVMLNESGSPVPFYVAKHDYESGLNGAGRTLLVRKNCYDSRQYSSSNSNNYSASSIDSWYNSNYKSLLTNEIQTMIGRTKFYCTNSADKSKCEVLERSIFMLSLAELGLTSLYATVEGSALPIAGVLQVAHRNGVAVDQWLRTPMQINTNAAYYITAGAIVASSGCTSAFGSRPAFTLPANTKFSIELNADGSYTLL